MPTSSEIEGHVIGGRWRVGPLLGEGGVGAVYRGQHVDTERRVAIKILHAQYARADEFCNRFEREARLASKLSHPSCVSILDFGEYEGRLYLVMEFAEGQRLSDRMDQGPLSPPEAVQVARGVALALRHAHGLGVVHRDLKPANIMLVDPTQAGVTCKLLDFGGAKSVAPERRDQLTAQGQVFGTPGYLAPEQIRGQPDARSDLYALGILMWEMLVGQRPFVHPDTMDVIRDHLHTPPPTLGSRRQGLSPELEALVARLLEKRAEARFQSADDLLRALAALPEARSWSAAR